MNESVMKQGHNLFQDLLHPASPGGTPSFGFGASQSAGGNAFGQPAAQGQAATTPAFGQQAAPQAAPAFGTQPAAGASPSLPTFGQAQPSLHQVALLCSAWQSLHAVFNHMPLRLGCTASHVVVDTAVLPVFKPVHRLCFEAWCLSLCKVQP